MPPLPSMEGQQGEVVSPTAVSPPTRKKREAERAAKEAAAKEAAAKDAKRKLAQEKEAREKLEREARDKKLRDKVARIKAPEEKLIGKAAAIGKAAKPKPASAKATFKGTKSRASGPHAVKTSVPKRAAARGGKSSPRSGSSRRRGSG